MIISCFPQFSQEEFLISSCELLKTLLSKLELVDVESIEVNCTLKKYRCLTLKGRVYSTSSKKHSSAVALALWDETLYGPCPTPLSYPGVPNCNNRPVIIHYFLEVSFVKKLTDSKSLTLAHVSWPQPHPQRHNIC